MRQKSRRCSGSQDILFCALGAGTGGGSLSAALLGRRGPLDFRRRAQNTKRFQDSVQERLLRNVRAHPVFVGNLELSGVISRGQMRLVLGVDFIGIP